MDVHGNWRDDALGPPDRLYSRSRHRLAVNGGQLLHEPRAYCPTPPPLGWAVRGHIQPADLLHGRAVSVLAPLGNINAHGRHQRHLRGHPLFHEWGRWVVECDCQWEVRDPPHGDDSLHVARRALLAATGVRACSYDSSSGALAYVSLAFNALRLVAGASGSTVRATFLASLIADLAAALGVPSSRISIASLDVDANVALVALLPGTPVTAPPSVASLIAQLDLLVRTPGSALYAGAVTSNVDAGTTLAPSFALAPAATAAFPSAVSLTPTLALLWTADAAGVTMQVRRRCCGMEGCPGPFSPVGGQRGGVGGSLCTRPTCPPTGDLLRRQLVLVRRRRRALRGHGGGGRHPRAARRSCAPLADRPKGPRARAVPGRGAPRAGGRGVGRADRRGRPDSDAAVGGGGLHGRPRHHVGGHDDGGVRVRTRGRDDPGRERPRRK